MKRRATSAGATRVFFFAEFVRAPRNSRSIIALLSGLGFACSSGAAGESVSARRAALEVVTWRKLSVPAAATTRAYHLFVYDSVRGNCVVFGGRSVDDAGRSLADTGIWTGDVWQPLAMQHAKRGYVEGAFDADRAVVLAFGGADLVAASPVYYSDTWEFDGATWVQRTPRASPSKRSSNGLAYDSRRGVSVLFGGYDGTWKNDVWEWNGADWTLKCDKPPCSTSARPAGRALSALVYDEARGVTVLFGGSADKQAYADTWLWNGESWAEAKPAHVPPGRDSPATAYDPVTKRVLLFGGVAPPSQDLNDLWAWNGSDWSNIAQAPLPTARRGAGLVWDVNRDRGILLGGSASGAMADAWEFTLNDSPCMQSADCHVGACVDGTCSTQPSGSGGSPTTGGTANGATGGAAPAGEVGGATSGGSSSTGRVSHSTGGGSNFATGGMREAPGGGASDDGGEGGAPATGGGVDMTPPKGRSASSVNERKSFYSCTAHPAGSSRTASLPVFIALLSSAVALRRRRA